MSLQSFIRLLLPREDSFYDLLERQALVAFEGATALAAFARPDATVEAVCEAVQGKEHEGDAIVHQVEEALARTFVTPIDREDLQKLSSELDDVLDLANSAARSSALMGVSRPSEAMASMLGTLVEAAAVLRDAVPNLRTHDYAALIAASRTLRTLEKDADRRYRDAVFALFHDERIDAKVLLREKTVLEELERAIDCCEHVGDTLANLAVKHG
jgi:hypothetical protein